MKEWKKCFRLKLEFSACLTGVEHGRLLIGAKIKIPTNSNSFKKGTKLPKSVQKPSELDKYFE